MTIRKITLGIVIATILVTPSAATLFIQQEAAEAYIDPTTFFYLTYFITAFT